MSRQKIFLPVIAGPTASGKTALSVALAKQLNAEVVSADSMQIYQTLRIATARPDEVEMDGIPHHLLGFLPLSAAYSVAQYVEDAGRVIGEIRARGKQPLLCGGTGLYIQSLIENIRFAAAAPADLAYREALKAQAEQQGYEVLLEKLAVSDPETAARLHPNDHGRILRAWEIYHLSGMTVSEHNRLSRQQPSPYDACVILLDFRERQHLHDCINARVDRMLSQGLLTEAQTVLKTADAPTAMQAIGCKELAPYFAGACPLETAVEKIKQETRRYAKRQLTWFRRMPVLTLWREDYATAEELTEAALALIRAHRADN